MPSATTSGSDAKSGNANQRGGTTPQAGNQQRTWTPEQKAAVLRVKNCNATDYYAILDLTALRPPATCSTSDVRKAYRKLSLLTHPDKNGHEHAHMAFQMVSKAYLVLSDEGKKESYDRSGRDPDSRFGGGGSSGGGGGGGGAAPSNPFTNGGFGQRPRGGGWEEEISPEEMFKQFFGGGGGGFGPFGGGGIFDGGASPFVFQMGGGPGIRVHQFGGGRPRRRPRTEETAGADTPVGVKQMLINLLPLFLIILFPLLTSLFSGSSSGPEKPFMYFPPVPHIREHDLTPQSPISAFKNAKEPYTLGRITNRWNVEYYMDPLEVAGWSNRDYMNQDHKAETKYYQILNIECRRVQEERQTLMSEAQGFFGLFVDENKMARARNLDASSCTKLNSLGR